MTNKRKPKQGYECEPKIVPFRFTEPHITHLRNTLGSSLTRDNTEALIKELEQEIVQFLANEIRENKKPRRREITAALDELNEYASGLAARLAALDVTTRRVIAARLPELPFYDYEYTDKEYHDYVELLIDALENFRLGIMRGRKDDLNLLSTVGGGRPKGLARRTFAIRIASILENHIGQKSAATHSGLYESILCICLGVATGKKLSDVHELACEALRMRDRGE